MADLYTNSSLFVPLSAQYLVGGKAPPKTQKDDEDDGQPQPQKPQNSFEYLSFFQGNKYESSAVFASAINTVVQPLFKRGTSHVLINDLLKSLSVQPAMKMGLLSTMMPFNLLSLSCFFFYFPTNP